LILLRGGVPRTEVLGYFLSSLRDWVLLISDWLVRMNSAVADSRKA
jgi:hypothetical protein